MAASSSQLALDLKVQGMMLEIAIINHGPESVRVWDRHNSWGWGTLSLEIAVSSRPEEVFGLTPKPRLWTKNSPGFIEIAASRSQVVVLTIGDPEWDGFERISHLRGEALRIRVNLEIPPSPEAETHGVFVGKVSSPWRESKPPHPWLFRDAQL